VCTFERRCNAQRLFFACNREIAGDTFETGLMLATGSRSAGLFLLAGAPSSATCAWRIACDINAKLPAKWIPPTRIEVRGLARGLCPSFIAHSRIFITAALFGDRIFWDRCSQLRRDQFRDYDRSRAMARKRYPRSRIRVFEFYIESRRRESFGSRNLVSSNERVVQCSDSKILSCLCTFKRTLFL